VLRDALVTGSIACIATLAAAALCGSARKGNAIAPINATSHVLWGGEAAQALRADLKHTVPGVAINEGASLFWAAIYEQAFGRRADRGEWGTALAGGAAVASLAYLVDYHLVSKRLTPGWELHLDARSLAAIYAALAISLPLRGLLRRARA
jgi:hypothetical protein